LYVDAFGPAQDNTTSAPTEPPEPLDAAEFLEEELVFIQWVERWTQVLSNAEQAQTESDMTEAMRSLHALGDLDAQWNATQEDTPPSDDAPAYDDPAWRWVREELEVRSEPAMGRLLARVVLLHEVRQTKEKAI
jgi:hypothetical protein